jgi:hypothetical protein
MARKPLEPTVTIGGAPAGYKPETSLQSTANFGGAPTVYQQVGTPNYITGANVPGVQTTSSSATYRGFREAEEASNKPFYDANPEYVARMLAPEPVTNGGGDDQQDNKDDTTDTGATLVSTETDEYGNVIGFYSDGTTKILIKSGRTTKTTVDEDAYALLAQTFKDYGLEELVPVIQGYMDRNLGANQAALELRKEPAYQRRFKGNETRRAVGLNVLSEAEYLNLENSYSETLRAYGLQNYFGADRNSKTAAMADIIGNDISATEFKDRIDTVVTRVQNSDPTIKSTLRSFYNITDDDLVSYFLNPKDNLPKLQEKVTSAEIGAAAKGQGLATSMEAATALAQFGVTKQQAQEGYQAVGAILPTASKLGDIYGEQYTQATAEEEVFKGTASAARKRQRLAALEEAQFGGAAGRLRTGTAKGNQGAF